MKAMAQPRVDLGRIAELADLRSIITADLGHPHRGDKWCCPFHADANPSLGLTPDRKHFKCWGCGETGDALDWLKKREGLGVIDAARVLDLYADRKRPNIGSTRTRQREVNPPVAILDPHEQASRLWVNPEWQAAVDQLVRRAERVLWSSIGRDARDWLIGRGLDEGTIRRFRLGFLPEDGWTKPVPRPDGTIAGIGYARGISIPWAAPGSSYGTDENNGDGPQWCGLNVRRLMPDVHSPWEGKDKLKCLRGSQRGFLYPFADILPSQGPDVPAMLVEGELDALIGWQQAGWVVNVATAGSASVRRLSREAKVSLARAPWILLALDHDEAGAEGARGFRDAFPHKAKRALLPAKDLGEFHDAGGDVLGWLEGEFNRLGWRWPLRPRAG